MVSSRSEKSSTASTWTAPAGTTSRATPAATGGGKVSSLLGDSGAPVATGTAAGRTATSSVAGGAAPLFSVVVSPGTGTVTPPTNVAPIASFTSSCTNLACSFNANGSSDANNDPLTYAWNFGDNTTGTGVTTSRTYATAATRTVTLTVSDGTLTNRRRARSPRPPPRPVPRLPVPNHTAIVPETAHTDMPKIANGEIFDIKVVGTRVFIAGSFTSIQNQRSGNTTLHPHRPRVVQPDHRPGRHRVQPAVHRRCRHHRVHARQHQDVRHRQLQRDQRRHEAWSRFPQPDDRCPADHLHGQPQCRGSEVVATNSTVYVGGRFTTVNGTARTSLAAVSATTGAVDTGFVNNLSGGLGVDGALTVQRLLLTHDMTKLIVIHTGRQVAGHTAPASP